MQKGEKLYAGKAKEIYATDDPTLAIMHFRDDATAFNGVKKGTIVGKGEMNCQISARIFEKMEEQGIETHYVKTIGKDEMVVKRSEIVPVEVVMRNVVAGSLSKRLGIPEGKPVNNPPLLEWYYKSDELNDPMINCGHIRSFGFATDNEMDSMREQAFKVDAFLKPYFASKGIVLVDYKLEFGRCGGKLILCDEITPDGCRLWDSETQEKLDKDRFRRDLGGVEEAYKRVWDLVTNS
jgi:phosphoribosylaminoimidazole-succinocarboxamide synthase